MLQKTILLKRLNHRDKRVLMLCFSYDQELINVIKRSTLNARYTQTYRAWWVVDSPENLTAIFNLFKGIAWLELEWKMKPERARVASSKRKEPLPDKVPAAYKDLLERRRYSESTYMTYVSMFNQFLHFIAPKDVEEVGEEDIRKYQDYLVKVRKVSLSTQNQAINAIKFYFEKLKGEDRKTYYIERPRKEKKLPVVLDEKEVLRILEHTENPKHRLIFAFLYATGLRIGELLNLRIADVDIERQVVHVKKGKGKKDRITLLSNELIPVILAYFEHYKPNYWFMEGPTRKRYTACSVRAALKDATNKAGLKKQVTPHTFRHSFATHLHEHGTDIRNIQELLGHNSTETTMIYTYVSKLSLQKLTSPLDQILKSNKLIDK
jgi:site-specific recombinase XerD